MSTVTHLTTVPHTGKHTVYDSLTRDYTLYFNGDLVGFARDAYEAERALNAYAYDTLTHTPAPAPLDCADLAAQFRRSKSAAGRLLMTLTPVQLHCQAVAYAAHVNNLHGLELTMDDVLANWRRGVARTLGLNLEAA